MDNQYKNAIGDWFVSDAKREERQTYADAELAKAEALLKIANKPASSNKALIIIPIAVVTIGGIIAIILTRKKK